jgi:hypothetical protein
MRLHMIGPATVMLMGDCTVGLEPEPNPTNPLVGGTSLESALNVRKKRPVGAGQRIDAPRLRRIGATTNRWSGLSPSNVRTGS